MDKILKAKDCVKELSSLVNHLEPRYNPECRPERAKQLLGEMKYRILHANDNPVDRALKVKQSEIERIKRENDRLRARLSLLEAGNSADVTRRIDDAVNSASQIEQLTKRVNELKAREEKILNSFKKTSREFREVCYLLTGYRIDPLKDDVYRLSHMYAEHEEDRLYFELKPDGTITLLKNEFTDQYKEFISTYLENADSFPAFLAAITLDLFKASTQVDMSMDMSTTMIQNTTMVRSNRTARKH